LKIDTNHASGTLSVCSQAEANGVITFSSCKLDKAGTGYTLHATDGTLTATDTSSFNVATGAVSAAVSTVSASPTALPADGTTSSTITVTLTDAGGNPVSGKTVTLAQGAGHSSISAASGPSDSSGVVTF